MSWSRLAKENKKDVARSWMKVNMEATEASLNVYVQLKPANRRAVEAKDVQNLKLFFLWSICSSFCTKVCVCGCRGGGIMSSLASQKQISFKIPCLCSLNVPHQCRVVMNIDSESRPSNSNVCPDCGSIAKF